MNLLLIINCDIEDINNKYNKQLNEDEKYNLILQKYFVNDKNENFYLNNIDSLIFLNMKKYYIYNDGNKLIKI